MRYDTYLHYDNEDSKRSHSDQVIEPMITLDLHINFDEQNEK